MFVRVIIPTLLAAAMTASPGSAAAPREVQPRPAQLQRLVDCRRLSDQAERLACYDRETAALEQAQVSGQLVVMDRQQVHKTRRSLFGLALPDLGVFGDNSSDEDKSELQTTIKVARQDPRGRWTFDLAEGGRWVQLDSRRFVIDPAPGQPVRIRRAALGSYLANVNKQIAVRVQRIN